MVNFDWPQPAHNAWHGRHEAQVRLGSNALGLTDGKDGFVDLLIHSLAAPVAASSGSDTTIPAILPNMNYLAFFFCSYPGLLELKSSFQLQSSKQLHTVPLGKDHHLHHERLHMLERVCLDLETSRHSQVSVGRPSVRFLSVASCSSSSPHAHATTRLPRLSLLAFPTDEHISAFWLKLIVAH